MAATTLRISIRLESVCSNKEPFFLRVPTSTLTNHFLPPQLPRRSAGVRCSSRRRGSGNRDVTSKKINKKKVEPENVGEDIDEDAIEALFRQLEEDLKNDELNGDEGGDDLSEEELAKLEQELAEALEDDDLFGALGSAAFGDAVNEDEEEDSNADDDEDGSEVDDEEEDEEEEMPIKLRSWQLRRLGYALKKGRRKTSIKHLAADLCLDRAVVLKLLRDPPPNLVMLSASLPDKPEMTILDPEEKRLDPEEKQVEPVPEETTTHAAKPEVKVKEPIHVMQGNWSAHKRLKKVQVETLEQVYRRSKRPTNAMISSIVHVTNLPRKKVVKWFEDKRAEEGVPENRRPYERSASESESVFTS